MSSEDNQQPPPAICPRCGNWYPMRARRCPIHRVVLIRPDARVRSFGPENLSSTIQTVVEAPARRRRPPARRRGRGRWPSRELRPLRFFEATTRPGDEVPHTPDAVGSLATVIPDAEEVTGVELDQATTGPGPMAPARRRRSGRSVTPVQAEPDAED